MDRVARVARVNLRNLLGKLAERIAIAICRLTNFKTLFIDDPHYTT